ncbi:unnamed protein product [Cuscuta europaea]|uniref:Uncharacterized protein n=1 Tax=Cuscuta europaea TaxID=41803 RepID=A0A9P1E849_CUSEU|nr:unnamed protein product [Cuscuta europaea]
MDVDVSDAIPQNYTEPATIPLSSQPNVVIVESESEGEELRHEQAHLSPGGGGAIPTADLHVKEGGEDGPSSHQDADRPIFPSCRSYPYPNNQWFKYRMDRDHSFVGGTVHSMDFLSQIQPYVDDYILSRMTTREIAQDAANSCLKSAFICHELGRRADDAEHRARQAGRREAGILYTRSFVEQALKISERRADELEATADRFLKQTAQFSEMLDEFTARALGAEQQVFELEAELAESKRQFENLKGTADAAVKSLVEAEENAMASEIKAQKAEHMALGAEEELRVYQAIHKEMTDIAESTVAENKALERSVIEMTGHANRLARENEQLQENAVGWQRRYDELEAALRESLVLDGLKGIKFM